MSRERPVRTNSNNLQQLNKKTKKNIKSMIVLQHLNKKNLRL